MKLSSFAGNSGVPVGGTIDMPVDIVGNQIVDGAATYLRAGVLIPYVSPAHDKIAALGFKQNKWLAASNNSQSIPPVDSTSTYNTFIAMPNRTGRMFAMGKWGQLAPCVVQGTWIFTGIGNDAGQSTPIMLVEPSPISQNRTRPSRSCPVWNAVLNVWVIFEVVSYDTSSNTGTMVLWTSYDGVNWQQSNTLQSANAGLNIASANYITECKAVCIGQTVVVYCKSSSGAFQSGIDIADNLRTITLNSQIVSGLLNLGASNSVTQFTQVTADVAIITNMSPTGGSPAVSNVWMVHKNSPVPVLINSVSLSKTYVTDILTDRNDTTVMIVDLNPGYVYRLPIVNNVISSLVPVTTTGIFGSYTNWNASSAIDYAKLAYTGAYWVLAYSWNGSGICWNTTDGATWLSMGSPTPGRSFGWDIGCVTKNHIAGWDPTLSKNTIYTLGTSGTSGAIAGAIPGNNDLITSIGYQCPVLFNGLTYAINGATIKSWGSDGIESLAYYSVTNDNLGNSDKRYLKVVNGRLFAVGNTGRGTLVQTADGTTWTSVALPAGVGTSVNDVEFFSGRYVVCGNYGAAYSSDLVTWTPVTDMPSANCELFLNAGSYILCITATGVRRSTDGITWTVPTTGNPTISAEYSGVFDGTSCHVFTRTTTSYTTTKFTTTDGNTFTSTVIANPIGNKDFGSIVSYFFNYNGKFYCKGTNLFYNPASAIVLTTTDFVNYTVVSTLIPITNTVNSSRLFVKNGILRYKVRQTSPFLSNFEQIIDAPNGAALIGLDNSIKRNDGLASFLRIS